MLKTILYVILMIFLISIIGNIVLETFPQLQPLWNEFKEIVVKLYQTAEVKYGTVVTILIIISIFILVGTSNNNKKL